MASPEPRPRRMLLLDAASSVLGSIDLTGIINANAQAPLELEVQQRCDLGHYHQLERIPLAPWGSD
jgi:hypothetical protein